MMRRMEVEAMKSLSDLMELTKGEDRDSQHISAHS